MARQDRNPYEVLGLEPSATRVEIRAAYLRLAKKHHPDKNPGDKASEWIFKEVGRAYETLRGTSDTRSSRRDGTRHEDTEKTHARRERHAREQERERRERQDRARRQERAEQQEDRKTERESRERAEHSRQQDRYEQQARERAERERREEGQEHTHRQGRSNQSERKHSESTSNNEIWEDRLLEYLGKLPLPTALAYVLGIPSALIGLAMLRGVSNSSSELLDVWLMFAGLTASAMRSKFKDWLYWLGMTTFVASAVWAVAVSWP